MKSEFDASTTDHPYMVHEVKKLGDEEKFDSNLSGDWDKAVTFATLILPTDFIIPNKFNEMVEHKPSLFLVLPKVIQELVQVLHA